MLDHCPMADLHTSYTLIEWWRATDGRLAELASIGIESPSAVMVDAWTVLGDEIASIRAELMKRAREDAQKKGG